MQYQEKFVSANEFFAWGYTKQYCSQLAYYDHDFNAVIDRNSNGKVIFEANVNALRQELSHANAELWDRQLAMAGYTCYDERWRMTHECHLRHSGYSDAEIADRYRDGLWYLDAFGDDEVGAEMRTFIDAGAYCYITCSAHRAPAYPWRPIHHVRCRN